MKAKFVRIASRRPLGGGSRWRVGNSALAVIAHELFIVDRAGAGVYMFVAIMKGLFPLGIVIILSELVGALPAAVRGDSPAIHAAELYVLLMGAVLIGQQVAAAMIGRVGLRLCGLLDLRLRRRAMESVLAPPGLDHLENPEWRDRISKATAATTATYGPAGAVYASSTVIAALTGGAANIAVIGWFRWWLGILLLILWLAIRGRIHRENRELWKVLGFQTAGARRSAYFRDLCLTVPAAKEIRLFGIGRWLTNQYHLHWVDSMTTVWRERRMSRAPLLRLLPFALAVHVAVGLLLVQAASSGHTALTTVTLVLQALLGAAALGGAGTDDVLLDWGAAAIPALKEVENDLAQTTPQSHCSPSSPHPRFGVLALHNVTFSYPRQPRPILAGVNLAVAPGTSVALVGANGSGKTTIIKLICRLYEPTSGCVQLDGVDLAKTDVREWRQLVAVVFQDFVRYPASAADNVRFGAVNAALPVRALNKAIAIAGAGPAVSSLPCGLDTPLSAELAGGCNLSGGEWQSIALARAMYAVEGGARLLILDEPTAHLDAHAEAAFYSRFLEVTRRLTTIIVSHRFNAVRHADNICVLNNGRIAEFGPHSDLIRADGYYARMFQMQAGGYQHEYGDA